MTGKPVEVYTMTADQLDEYTRRVVAATLEDRTAQKVARERADRLELKRQQRADRIEGTWLGWMHEIDDMTFKAGDYAVRQLLENQRSTVPEIMARARQLDARVRAEYESQPPAPEWMQDAPPITYRAGDIVARLFRGYTPAAAECSAEELRVMVRRELVDAAEGRPRASSVAA